MNKCSKCGRVTKGKNTAANIYRYVLDVGTSMAGVLCSVCYFKSLINETPLSESIDFQDGHFTQSTTISGHVSEYKPKMSDLRVTCDKCGRFITSNLHELMKNKSIYKSKSRCVSGIPWTVLCSDCYLRSLIGGDFEQWKTSETMGYGWRSDRIRKTMGLVMDYESIDKIKEITKEIK